MILVVGSTGYLGGMITHRLLDKDHDVRILVRQNSAHDSLLEAGAHPVIGDMKDKDSLIRACEGVSTVITTANAFTRGGEDTIDSVDRIGNRNLIDAAKKAGVRHFIFMSAMGADPESPAPIISAKGQTEMYLQNSGVPYTILAGNIFMEVWIGLVVGTPLQAGHPITFVGKGDHKHAWIATGDVADFAVAAINHPMALNKTLDIGGPTPLSWNDIARTVGKVVGHPLDVQYVAPGEEVPLLPPVAGGILAWLEGFETRWDMAPLAKNFGVTFTPLEEVMQQMFGEVHAHAVPG